MRSPLSECRNLHRSKLTLTKYLFDPISQNSAIYTNHPGYRDNTSEIDKLLSNGVAGSGQVYERPLVEGAGRDDLLTPGYHDPYDVIQARALPGVPHQQQQQQQQLYS